MGRRLKTAAQPDGGFPIYILDDDTVIFDKRGITHTTFWKTIVCKLVVKKYKITQSGLHNFPYCQRRARIVGNNLYCGEKISKILLKKIEKAVDIKLNLIYDEHETRCKISILEFNALKSPCLQ